MKATYSSERNEGGIVYITFKGKERAKVEQVIANLSTLGYDLVCEDQDDDDKYTVTIGARVYNTIAEMKEDYNWSKERNTEKLKVGGVS